MKYLPGHGPEVLLQQPLPLLRGPRSQPRGLAASVSPAAARARGGTGTIAQFIFNYFPHKLNILCGAGRGAAAQETAAPLLHLPGRRQGHCLRQHPPSPARQQIHGPSPRGRYML